MNGVVVITGGSRGIGAATARRAARDGWDVVLGYRSDRAAAQAVVADCETFGRTAVAVQCDVAKEDEVLALFDAVPASAPLRGLVNNAGIVAPETTVSEMSADRIRRLLEVNVLGAFVCAREAVRRMSTSQGGGGGAIVNVSSGAAVMGAPGTYVDYAASKAALDALTTGLSREVADQGIRVNTVRPGLIDTEIHERNGQLNRLDKLRSTIPMGRAGTAEEVASAIVWLLSDESSYSTGAFIDVRGGR